MISVLSLSRFFYTAILAILFSVLVFPGASFAQQSTGGIYTLQGQITPVTGSQSGGVYSNTSGGNPVTAGSVTSASGYTLNGGVIASSSPPQVSAYSQGAYYSQGSYGGASGLRDVLSRRAANGNSTGAAV